VGAGALHQPAMHRCFGSDHCKHQYKHREAGDKKDWIQKSLNHAGNQRKDQQLIPGLDAQIKGISYECGQQHEPAQPV